MGGQDLPNTKQNDMKRIQNRDTWEVFTSEKIFAVTKIIPSLP